MQTICMDINIGVLRTFVWSRLYCACAKLRDSLTRDCSAGMRARNFVDSACRSVTWFASFARADGFSNVASQRWVFYQDKTESSIVYEPVYLCVVRVGQRLYKSIATMLIAGNIMTQAGYECLVVALYASARRWVIRSRFQVLRSYVGIHRPKSFAGKLNAAVCM